MSERQIKLMAQIKEVDAQIANLTQKFDVQTVLYVNKCRKG